MCVICGLFEKDKLTIKEAKKAAWELVLDKTQDEKHLQELYARLEELEQNDQKRV